MHGEAVGEAFVVVGCLAVQAGLLQCLDRSVEVGRGQAEVIAVGVSELQGREACGSVAARVVEPLNVAVAQGSLQERGGGKFSQGCPECSIEGFNVTGVPCRGNWRVATRTCSRGPIPLPPSETRASMAWTWRA